MSIIDASHKAADFCASMKRIKINQLTIFFALLLIASFLFSEEVIEKSMSKPMPPPTKQEALNSDYIVIAEYQGYKQPLYGEINYFNSPIA